MTHKMFWKAILRWGGMLALAAAIFWQVARSSGEPYGRAIVHVSEPGTTIMLDDVAHPVDELDALPVVFEVLPGPHQIRLLRGEQTVDDQRFELNPDEELVLCLWSGNLQKPSPAPEVPYKVVSGRPSR